MVSTSFVEEQEKKPRERPKVPADADSPPFYLPLRSFQSKYRVISDLGNGSFGNVSLAKSFSSLQDQSAFKSFKHTLMERNDEYQYENYANKKTGLVAIKTMNKRLSLLNDYTRVKEVRFILSLPYHKNLVQVYEMFIDNQEFKLHIAMECMDQNLYQLMKSRKHNKFSEPTLRSILSQILNGMRHIHRHEYFHRDIKPENILISPSNRFYDQDYINSDAFKFHDNFVVKLADFGLARHIENKRPYTSYVSTRWYRAPEILLRNRSYSRPIDVWAFGSVAAELAMFRPLFPGSDELDQTWKVVHVLGTPSSENCLENYQPSYGYWDGAGDLFRDLGLNMPEVPCIDISQMIQSPSLTLLCDVIRACLIWNPDNRATVDTVCDMPYFRGTCVDDHLRHESVVDPYSTLYGSRIPGAQFNYDQFEKLAGISSSKPRSLQLQKEEVQAYQDTEFATVGSSLSPLCTDGISFSYLKDLNTPQHKTSRMSDFGFQDSFPLDGSTNELIPALTDGGRTNDENHTSLLTPLGMMLSNHYRDCLKALPSVNIPSFIDPQFGTPGKIFHQNTYFHAPAELPSMDLGKMFTPAQHYHQSLTDCIDSASPHVGQQSYQSVSRNGIDQFYTNDIPDILDDQEYDFDGVYDDNRTTADDLLGMFELETSPPEAEDRPHVRDGSQNSTSAKGQQFSNALYSKFSLRNQQARYGDS